MKILVVEDNEMNLELMRAILSANSFEYIEARDGREAITVTMAESPDLILMDLQMPVLDGFGALREIRKQPAFTTLPIIAVSGNATDYDRDQSIAAGFNDFMSKPYKVDTLLDLIATHGPG